jgi:[ribosomal protein S18]-alanine N-acetyltransferase
MATLATQIVQIRLVRTGDLGSIHQLEEACFKDPFPPYFINQLAEANPSTFLVAEEAGRIIGYAVVDTWTDHQHLVSIAVRPDSQRRGVGQALLDQLTGRLRPGQLRLELRMSNRAALALYLKNGFTQTGTAHSYYTDGEDAIQMEKLITKSHEISALA